MLITFEGCEGCGKSTQVSCLQWHLIDFGCSVIQLREPGSTSIGSDIRRLLMSGKGMNALCEAFLFNAARAQLVQESIVPALTSGRVVLCDRYCDSTIAYQGYGRGLDLEELQILNSIATAGAVPQITILLDIDPEVGLKRKANQGEWNRMDGEELAFHQRVRAGYLEMAALEPERWFVVDASRSVDDVKSAIWQHVFTRSGLSM